MNLSRAGLAGILCAALLTSGCGWISFAKPMSDEEFVLQSEIRNYYDDVSDAFAGGNAGALVGLYDDTIAVPMTRDQILAWATDFFQKHGPARFQVEKIDVDAIGHVSADVVLTYRVETRDGVGSFRGVELDHFLKHGRRWYVSAWEKLPAEQR
jgi:ketosteroid isomerase-like protein